MRIKDLIIGLALFMGLGFASSVQAQTAGRHVTGASFQLSTGDWTRVWLDGHMIAELNPHLDGQDQLTKVLTPDQLCYFHLGAFLEIEVVRTAERGSPRNAPTDDVGVAYILNISYSDGTAGFYSSDAPEVYWHRALLIEAKHHDDEPSGWLQEHFDDTYWIPSAVSPPASSIGSFLSSPRTQEPMKYLTAFHLKKDDPLNPPAGTGAKRYIRRMLPLDITADPECGRPQTLAHLPDAPLKVPFTATPSYTGTFTRTPTPTASWTPTRTFTFTRTPTPVFTSTNSTTPTATASMTPSASFTASPTFTKTGTPTSSWTSSFTPSRTPTPRPTLTWTPRPSAPIQPVLPFAPPKPQAAVPTPVPVPRGWLGENAPELPGAPKLLPTVKITIPAVWTPTSTLPPLPVIPTATAVPRFVPPLPTAVPDLPALPAPAAGTTAPPAQPETMVFGDVPVNIYVSFADGPGRYKVEVVDRSGGHVRTLYEGYQAGNTSVWLGWYGTDEDELTVSRGRYTAVFYRDGLLLRRIFLDWVKKEDN